MGRLRIEEGEKKMEDEKEEVSSGWKMMVKEKREGNGKKGRENYRKGMGRERK